jgi:hypothetical protein
MFFVLNRQYLTIEEIGLVTIKIYVLPQAVTSFTIWFGMTRLLHFS